MPFRWKRVGAVIWAFGALVTGWQLLLEVQAIALTKQSTSWAQVEATILESGPVKGCGKGASFFPRVRYTYTHDGATLVGDAISLGNFYCSSETDIKKLTDPYKTGQIVSAWVNPQRPNQAVLKPGEITSDSTFGALLMAALAAGCAYFARLTWRDAA